MTDFRHADNPEPFSALRGIADEATEQMKRTRERESKTTVYVVLTNDRHTDPYVALFDNEADAVAHAESEVAECATHPELIEPEDREVSDAMRRDGLLWFCRYGVEGDSVRVMTSELRTGRQE
jgi:hypothetical protein